MKELLERQLKYLESIEKSMQALAKNSAQDKLIQLGQLGEERAINKDEDDVVKHLDHIDTNIESIEQALHVIQQQSAEGQQSSPTGEPRSTQKDDSAKTIIASLADELAKNTKVVAEMNKKYSDATKSENANHINKSIFEKFSDAIYSVKETFNSVKSTVTDDSGKLSLPKAMQSSKDAILSSVSGKYSDKLNYIRDQVNLGSQESRKTLEREYKKRRGALIAKERLDAKISKNLGGLTEEEYFKGNTEEARRIKSAQNEIGKVLYETDRRNILNDQSKPEATGTTEATTEQVKPKATGTTEATTEQVKPKAKPNKLKESVESIAKSAPTEATVAPILTSAEDKAESNRELVGFHDSQNDLLSKLVSNSDDGLKILTNIESLLKTTSDNSDSDGSSLLDNIGYDPSDRNKSSKRKPKGKGKTSASGGLKGMMSKGSDLIKSGSETIQSLGKSAVEKIGPSLVRGAGSIATEALGVMANPVTIAAGYALHEGAKAFSESFGEGGFDLIQKLRKSDAISYGFDATPEVDDWKQIEALQPKELQTLIDTKEFEGEDLKKIQSILANKSNVQPARPEGTQPKDTQLSTTPVENTESSITPQVANSAESQVKPIAPSRTSGMAVYNASREANETPNNTQPQPTSIVSAPTTNINNNVQSQSIRLPVRVVENSINRYVTSRYAIQ